MMVYLPYLRRPGVSASDEKDLVEMSGCHRDWRAAPDPGQPGSNGSGVGVRARAARHRSVGGVGKRRGQAERWEMCLTLLLRDAQLAIRPAPARSSGAPPSYAAAPASSSQAHPSANRPHHRHQPPRSSPPQNNPVFVTGVSETSHRQSSTASTPTSPASLISYTPSTSRECMRLPVFAITPDSVRGVYEASPFRRTYLRSTSPPIGEVSYTPGTVPFRLDPAPRRGETRPDEPEVPAGANNTGREPYRSHTGRPGRAQEPRRLPVVPARPQRRSTSGPQAFQHANTRSYGLMPLRDILRGQRGQEAGAGIPG